MTPASTEDGKNNLREGIKKMAKAMTPAAKVRRNFQLGRPQKPPQDGDVPLHRTVVWHKAMRALIDFRSRMADAGLDPTDAKAEIVCLEATDPQTPQFLPLEEKGKLPEQTREDAFRTLGRDDVIAIGLVFEQWDWHGGNDGQPAIATFPYRFMGLSPHSAALLKACAIQQQTRLQRMAEGVKRLRGG